VPVLADDGAAGHRTACHFWPQIRDGRAVGSAPADDSAA
jgi:hypothetical protein